ncbi:unnamed protein product [Mycetohabitans rhizoxinica HKI 454]|uniref:Uncharacterized protein n=1 Tax=Mycetohabitans rhizoxinica (strain DSM 19002 / CIP 109453 / HKI 454) TaxID=882378 RepID=E5AQF3_MYCRK|nr:unnamed protein product [Mycetohabitans rhizoxinica HKI 454]
MQVAIIAYPWHPAHGQQFRVVRRSGRRGNQLVHLDVPGGLSRELPVWMLDASICSTMSLGSPQLSLSALNELRANLHTRALQPTMGGSSKLFSTEGNFYDAGKQHRARHTTAFDTGERSSMEQKPRGQSTRRVDSGAGRSTTGSTGQSAETGTRSRRSQ